MLGTVLNPTFQSIDLVVAFIIFLTPKSRDQTCPKILLAKDHKNTHQTNSQHSPGFPVGYTEEGFASYVTHSARFALFIRSAGFPVRIYFQPVSQ